MQLEALKWLEDARLAAERVQRFAAGRSAHEYASDELLCSAIERQFGIIGEAVNQLRRIDPASATRISNHQRIVAFRNRLVHRYWDLRPEVVWAFIEHDLPMLIREVRTLLAEQDPQFEDPPPAQPQVLPPEPPS